MVGKAALMKAGSSFRPLASYSNCIYELSAEVVLTENWMLSAHVLKVNKPFAEIFSSIKTSNGIRGGDYPVEDFFPVA